MALHWRKILLFKEVSEGNWMGLFAGSVFVVDREFLFGCSCSFRT
jgi:hypothetical protein